MLMARIVRKVKDKRILKLIRFYLQSGVMINGVKISTQEGTLQGNPLSLLLANIFLDDLDREPERRGHKFVRYADDCKIYLKSKRAGQRVMESITAFALLPRPSKDVRGRFGKLPPEVMDRISTNESYNLIHT